MMESHPYLVVVCGWPLAGKTALARELEKDLKFHRIDIDEVRLVATGLPYPHPNESETLMQRDGQEMGAAYRFLLDMADWHLANDRPVIVTATFSRKIGQDNVARICARYPRVRARILWCRPDTADDDEIRKRLDRGFEEGGYVGGVNSLERYHEVKKRYEPIELPHELINTSSQALFESCVGQALAYIVNPQSHDSRAAWEPQ